jgi:hypothetical protein
MKAPPSWSGNMLHGQLQEPDQRKRPPLKAKTFNTLVARYYLGVTASLVDSLMMGGKHAR